MLDSSIPHPICKDLPRMHFGKQVKFKFVTLTVKNNNLKSCNLNKVLKRFKKRSFYRTITVISEAKNVPELQYILQILYSVATYAENNHYVNLLKLWIDDIYVYKKVNSNKFINKKNKNLKYSYDIVIRLGFNYKNPPIKQEPIW